MRQPGGQGAVLPRTTRCTARRGGLSTASPRTSLPTSRPRSRSGWATVVSYGSAETAAPRPQPAAAAGPATDTAAPLTERLRALHEAHVEQVNQALDEGREDLVRELADAYPDEALRLLVHG